MKGVFQARHVPDRAVPTGRGAILELRAVRVENRPICVFLAFAISLVAIQASDYFVSPHGRDDDGGLSIRQPWKSLERVNRHISENGLKPGDTIRFLGGCKFAGNLVLNRATGGTQVNPVLISSYGCGRATLLPGRKTGILIRETPWITVSNLDLTASSDSDGDGIRCDRDIESNQRIPGIEIRSCTARGFGWHGIMIDASQRSSGFERVVLKDCITTGNRYAGIMIYGGNPAGRTLRAHAEITVDHCVATGNPGDPDQLQHHSGSGILMDGVDSGLIHGCIAAANGAECRNDRGGPVGIWAHACRDVIIENCESYENRSCLRDGGGFDLDGGCENCAMRWNYSHDNHGPGFLVYMYNGAAYAARGCQIRGNISSNDGGQGSAYAGIEIGSENGCQIEALDVANNTVIAPKRSVATIRISGESIQATVRSNLVVAPAHGVLAALSGHHHHLHFIGNRYWRADGKSVFLIDSQWAIPTLGSWHSSSGPDTRFSSEGESLADPGAACTPSPRRRANQTTPFWPDFYHHCQPEVGAPRHPPGT